jgi:hypothetical protein
VVGVGGESLVREIARVEKLIFGLMKCGGGIGWFAEDEEGLGKLLR